MSRGNVRFSTICDLADVVPRRCRFTLTWTGSSSSWWLSCCAWLGDPALFIGGYYRIVPRVGHLVIPSIAGVQAIRQVRHSEGLVHRNHGYLLACANIARHQIRDSRIEGYRPRNRVGVSRRIRGDELANKDSRMGVSAEDQVNQLLKACRCIRDIIVVLHVVGSRMNQGNVGSCVDTLQAGVGNLANAKGSVSLMVRFCKVSFALIPDKVDFVTESEQAVVEWFAVTIVVCTSRTKGDGAVVLLASLTYAGPRVTGIFCAI